MTLDQFLQTTFYALLASFALAGSWRKKGRRQVGVTLFACWVVSNLTFWTLPIEWRPAIFPMLDVLFALTAAKAGKELESRVPIALIVLSVMAVTINTAFSIVGSKEWYPVRFYEVSLNIIFAMQCIITGLWGFIDVYGRPLGFLGRPPILWRDSKPVRHETDE